MSRAAKAGRGGILRALGRVGIVRLIVMAVVLIAIDVALQVGPALLLPRPPPGTGVWIGLAIALLLALAMCLAYGLLIRLIERRKAKELALVPGLAMAPLGIAIGAGLFCAVIAILWLEGLVSFGGSLNASGLVPALSMAIASAVGEELVFRGVLFRIVEDSLGTTFGVIVSAALFGLLHALNPGATIMSTAAVGLEAGVLLAAAYAASRNLWLPIGLHLGWNFTEGGIFGAAVSGGQGHGLLDTRISGPPLWSGGAFGPEASVAAVGVCLAVAAIFLWRAVAAGRWAPIRLRLMLD